MSRALLVVSVVSTFILAAGCSDATGVDVTPILVGDTVVIGAPGVAGNENFPNALDITGNGEGGVIGGRFTDSSADALQWDFALRVCDGEYVVCDGQFALLPQAALTIASRAAITEALPGQTFEGLQEAPSPSTFVTEEPVVLTEGAIHAARSRDAISAFGTSCPQFAKIKVIDVDSLTGRVELAILTNERCGDPRLVPTT